MTVTEPPGSDSTDRIPAGYVLPLGATLVEQRTPTWSYAIARAPDAVAAELDAALTAAGWLTVRRHIATAVPTVTAVQDGPVVIAILGSEGAGTTRLTLVVNASGNLLTKRPPRYPAEFPFLAFGAVQAEPRDDRTVLIYAAKGADIFQELADRLVADTWSCSGDLDTLLVCRKGTIEVTVSMHELSADKVVMFVSNAELIGDALVLPDES